MELYIENIAELETLRHAMEMVIDIEGDTLFDNFPWSAKDIREMATMSDEDINKRLSEARKAEDARIARLEAAQDLLRKLRNI